MKDAVSDVTIVGGGFAGLFAGAWLADLGLSVVIVEARPERVERSLRGELLHPTGVAALEKLGLGPALEARDAARIPGFAAYGPSGRDPAILPYGAFGLGLEHHLLVESLRKAVACRERVRLVEGTVHDAIRREGAVVGVRTADGRTFTSPLVVVADGRHSRLRAALGFPSSRRLLSRSIGVQIDVKHLPVPDHAHVLVGGPGPILVYPISRRSARVNVDVPLDAPRRGPVLARYVAESYARDVAPELFEAILRAFERGTILGAANHAVTTYSCATRGAVLLGDAGGCSHPMTATGMTSAIQDAVALGGALSAHGMDPGSEDALLGYQQRRYRFVRPREAFAQALFDIFRGSDPGSRALRDAVFQYWQSERARRASMAILVGDEPRTRVFATEYARVAMLSSRALLRDGSVSARVAAFSGALEAARTASRLFVDKVVTGARARSLQGTPHWMDWIMPAPRPPAPPSRPEQSQEPERALAG